MPDRRVRIGPSILSADFLRLGEQIAEAEAAGADFVHVDVMDGRFVPNISVGLPLVEAVRRATKLPVDVHLMIVEPDRWVERFVAAGADLVTVHVEADPHLHRTLRAIEEAGGQPSVALNPATPIAALEEVFPLVRQVLLMSVNPGFGGQTFIPATLDKIRHVLTALDARNPTCLLEVDGGIKAGNLGRIVAAGADTIVAGSAVFAPDRSIAETMAELRAVTDSVR
ncbi:MAG: Ribulose-phosphate 3-epimerase [uncultured Thermomicrobiales bacterium]|uniref:Ribulose-phosphate 3-epimerase n=1 Tax=uncultured Thermomicrobiales bacterium TaxID=1645740 RepID=A0A6J4V7A7_9BACT|nr:MAG: Ribulose-phosphate 3-epimerase [uncultured Thermomicrobiales bacterium]